MAHFDFDLAVIGGGSAGYAAARTAARAGLNTAVIEGGQEVGGLCILRGCMPTKALLYAADVLHLTRKADTWGLRAPQVGFDFAAVMGRKNAIVKDCADDRARQLTGSRFKFVRAGARFLDARTLSLSTGASLSARYFVISTGSVVSEPPLPSLKEVGYLTSDEALTLTRPPESLIVLGGGAVAVEFAQFFARFGTEVTLIQRSAHILRDFDADASAELEKVFRREGITVFTNTRLLGARRDGDSKEVAFEHDGRTARVAAEEILFALGRTPNTTGLQLEQAGVKTEGRRIVADAHMRTNVPHIYAAGDCTGPHEIVHIAIQQGEIAAHNIAHPDRAPAVNYRLLTRVVFTDPQIGVVGFGEKEATAKNIPYLTARYPFDDHGKSLIMDAQDGFVKLLADPASGEILGGCCIGPMGGELIHEIIAAMAGHLTVQDLSAMPHYHPTLAEIWTYPAEDLAGRIRH